MKKFILYVKSKLNTLAAKVMIIVTIGVILLTQFSTMLANNYSYKLFVNVYGNSQQYIATKVKEEVEKYVERISNMCVEIEGSWNIHNYLIGKSGTPAEESSLTYNMQKDFSDAISSEIRGVTVLLVSQNGTISLNNSDTLEVTAADILGDVQIRNAAEQPNQILFSYQASGLTSSTKNESVIMGVKALTTKNRVRPYGYVVFLIPEKEISKRYDYGKDDYKDILLIDNKGTIISSTDKSMIGKVNEEISNSAEEFISKDEEIVKTKIDGKNALLICKNVAYVDCKLCVYVYDEKAMSQFYDGSVILKYTLLITLIVLAVLFLAVRATMRPVTKLREKMTYIKNGQFDQYVTVKGDSEVAELAETYNKMLDDLNHYVDSLMKTENEKRKAEIDALQMQINPHYVYNTLTSIKYLILQEDTAKSTKAIDAFIKLLRNTISNKKEYISIEEEIDNLKNYIYINEIRYGEKIKCEFFISVIEPEKYMMPKMLLQPFIENAFFHGFPKGENGTIMVCIREQGNNIRFDIIDDGVGMNQNQLDKLDGKSTNKSEHFTGIGINNIINRLALIYEDNYKLEFKSELSEGTTVTLILPQILKK